MSEKAPSQSAKKAVLTGANEEQLAQLRIEIDQLQSQIATLSKQQGSESQEAIVRCAACLPQCCVNQPTNPSQPNFIPDFNIPLIAAGGGDQYCAIQQDLGPLAGLLGTWVSPRFAGYNVMPLPQATAPLGFILKNVFYYEVTTFSAIQGKVANRAGTYEQDAYTIFYSQRVFFADGVQKDELVHAENGSWLHQVTAPQGTGPLDKEPYIGSPPAPNPIPPQDPTRAIVKQVSIPHGNSILALGAAEEIVGAPTIPVASALPIGAPDTFAIPYGTDVPQNPNVNPNIVLEIALEQLAQNGVKVDKTTVLSVDTDNHGQVANTPFMKENSNVPRFKTTFWLEQLSNGQLQLQYTQDITLEFPLQVAGTGNRKGGVKTFKFPHITANTLFKVK